MATVLSAARSQLNRVFERLAWALEALGFTPNAVTFLSLAVTGAGAFRIATGHFFDGALIAGIGTVLDAFDGALARRTGTTSLFGGYLDSLLDRYADGILFLAVAWHYDTAWIWAVSLVAFLGAVATSYARARTYQDASPPNDAWSDLVERGERLILLLAGVGVQGILHAVGRGPEYVPWLLVALAVLGHVTVVQRALRAKGFLEEAEPRG